MLSRKIIAVCSQIHTNTLCGQNVELLNVNPDGTGPYRVKAGYWGCTVGVLQTTKKENRCSQ